MSEPKALREEPVYARIEFNDGRCILVGRVSNVDGPGIGLTGATRLFESEQPAGQGNVFVPFGAVRMVEWLGHDAYAGILREHSAWMEDYRKAHG